MHADDWQVEYGRLRQVTNKIEQKIAELEPKIDRVDSQARHIRRHFWEEVTVNTSSAEDFEETIHSLNQQTAILSERERGHQLLTQQWKNLQRLLRDPYFGRIDFQERGLHRSEQVYIGVASLFDEDEFDFLVYDWRSPIASMYYDHSPGAAFYVAPSGRIDGMMERKRQYQIKDGQIRSMFDASITIGDELLQQVLGKGADAQMKSIVATIQQEQNAIIRDDKSKMLIVQGAAGSGKTSAALQRVAFLLYKHRDTLQADQVILFSPNRIFNSYVSTVLPELGEENMQQATLQEYLQYSLGASFRLEDPFDQIEFELNAQLTPDYEARVQGMKYKASESFMTALNNYALWLGRTGMAFVSIRFRDRTLISKQQMTTQFYSYPASVTLSQRVALLQRWLLDRLAVHERQELAAEWVLEELNYLDNEQYAEVFGELHKDREVLDIAEQYAAIMEVMHHRPRGDEGDFSFAHKEEELLRRKVVRQSFAPLRRSVQKLKFLDVKRQYTQFFSDELHFQEMTNQSQVPPLWADICAQTKAKVSRLELFYEDATPYLYLKELMEGVRTNRQIRYVFVDEGQDYSMFQYEYLRKLFPSARMTVLGDFRQAIFAQATNLHASDSPLLRLYDAAATNVFRLVRSYRSTREIVEFTTSLLPDGDEIVPFDRRGKKPLVVSSDSADQRDTRIVYDLAILRSEGFGSIAIITKTAAESVRARASLQERGCVDPTLVTQQTSSLEQGVVIVPVYLAKGVEFDAVLIYDASSDVYKRENERNLLYTACTRAMHRLAIYSVGEWSPFLQAVDQNMYESVFETGPS